MNKIFFELSPCCQLAHYPHCQEFLYKASLPASPVGHCRTMAPVALPLNIPLSVYRTPDCISPWDCIPCSLNQIQIASGTQPIRLRLHLTLGLHLTSRVQRWAGALSHNFWAPRSWINFGPHNLGFPPYSITSGPNL